VELAEYPQQQVFGTDLAVPHLPGGPVSTVNRRTSIIVEAFEHDITFYKR
jgi:hypothetical protein